MLKPAYKLTIGRKVVDTTDEPKASTVVDLKVALDRFRTGRHVEALAEKYELREAS